MLLNPLSSDCSKGNMCTPRYKGTSRKRLLRKRGPLNLSFDEEKETSRNVKMNLKWKCKLVIEREEGNIESNIEILRMKRVFEKMLLT